MKLLEKKNSCTKQQCKWVQSRAICYWYILHEIFDQLPNEFFTDFKWIAKACDRYFQIWLPLLEYAGRYGYPLVPPPDVELIWFCHMLAPESYEKDCMKTAQFMPNHALFDNNTRQKALNFAKYLWQVQYENEDFYLDYQRRDKQWFQTNYNVQRFSFNIFVAVEAMRIFFYQINLPHYKNEEFVGRGTMMYFCAIDSELEFERFFTGFNFYQLWHTHLLHPQKYKQDTESVHNGIYSHFQIEFALEPNQKIVLNRSKITEQAAQFWKRRLTQQGLEGTSFWGIPSLPTTKTHQLTQYPNSECLRIRIANYGKFQICQSLKKIVRSKQLLILQDRKDAKYKKINKRQTNARALHVCEVSDGKQGQSFYAKVVLCKYLQLHSVEVFSDLFRQKKPAIQVNVIGSEVLPQQKDVSSNYRQGKYPVYQEGRRYVQLCINGYRVAIVEAKVDEVAQVKFKAYWINRKSSFPYKFMPNYADGVYNTRIPFFNEKNDISQEIPVVIDARKGSCRVQNTIVNQYQTQIYSLGLMLSVGVLMAACSEDVAKILGDEEGSHSSSKKQNQFKIAFGASHQLLPQIKKRQVTFSEEGNQSEN
eukprot:TRINITY_DN2979_c0_g1_i3.p1 TRINITY_DN2979_c0_g1~~TRINITY_DN2979_c0_g1_i3.p1  ORF type:complete len:591 (-),score=43.21 TRINITY_DN2979_c0_g1_i3:1174-2946(-)